MTQDSQNGKAAQSSSTIHDRAWQLLRILADGQFHSGEMLARRLGVSRATVFNTLSGIEQWGVFVQRIRGRGYRLVQAWACMDAETIRQALGGLAQRFQIDVLEQATSSNALLLQRAAAGAPSGSVLVVELQTAGRGRLGRTWYSGLGNALTFSLLWRFDCGLNALSGLSLAVGVAIVRALDKSGLQGARLKWPNDILTAHGKLAGVLIEAQGDMHGPSAVVIGIGLNCTLPSSLERQIDQAATALEQLGATVPDRNQLLAVLLQELAGVLDEFAQRGFASLRSEWQRYHHYQDVPICMQLADSSAVDGIARGVNERGELCVETPSGTRCFNSGEVGAAAR